MDSNPDTYLFLQHPMGLHFIGTPECGWGFTLMSFLNFERTARYDFRIIIALGRRQSFTREPTHTAKKRPFSITLLRA